MKNEVLENGSIEQLAEILEKQAPKNVLIVSGGNSYGLSGAQKHIAAALGNIKWHRHYGFEENPKFPELLEGARKANAFSPDLIIAVGGGSVLDTAKIISILPEQEDAALSVIKGKKRPEKKLAPLIAIPTTSGSGSESTHFAVAYIDDTKYSVADAQLLPDYVLIDPELTHSMSPYQTAVSGMDALCQGIESYWAKGATEESREYAAEAIKIVLNNIEAAVNNPTPKARFEMAKGANLAGKAINISKTTAPHALSYGLTTMYEIPHGHAVGLTIGEVLRFNFEVKSSDVNDNRGLDYVKKTMFDLLRFLGITHYSESKEYFNKLLKQINLDPIPSSVTENIEEAILGIAKSVNQQRLSNNPRIITKEQLIDILRKSFSY